MSATCRFSVCVCECMSVYVCVCVCVCVCQLLVYKSEMNNQCTLYMYMYIGFLRYRGMGSCTFRQNLFNVLDFLSQMSISQ